ncbi:UAA transporter [Gautieria morchelliformis]|nr:UAA transporter [Gautieria morchelliformis]
MATNSASRGNKLRQRARQVRGETTTAVRDENTLPTVLALAVVDYALIVSLVFGGCCANAWSLEMLLKQGSSVGSALTFSQMFFIAMQALPSFITFRAKGSRSSWLPRLKPRAIPLSTWLVQVLLLVCMSLLNNWAFAYRVPLTVQIVVRSSGKYRPVFVMRLAVSMLFGYLIMAKTYSNIQIIAVVIVTSGVILTTLSGTSSQVHVTDDAWRYAIGISMLVLASLLTGYYGTLQEQTYTHYGPHWREGVFYTHLFSLPMFVFLRSDIQRGLASLSKSSSGFLAGTHYSYLVLALNVMTQLLCTSSVNRLSSNVSSVTTNLVLTTRKAFSLCLSVWWFGNQWDKKLGFGAGMVFLGTVLYTLSGSSGSRKSSEIEKDKTR